MPLTVEVEQVRIREVLSRAPVAQIMGFFGEFTPWRADYDFAGGADRLLHRQRSLQPVHRIIACVNKNLQRRRSHPPGSRTTRQRRIGRDDPHSEPDA